MSLNKLLRKLALVAVLLVTLCITGHRKHLFCVRCYFPLLADVEEYPCIGMIFFNGVSEKELQKNRESAEKTILLARKEAWVEGPTSNILTQQFD